MSLQRKTALITGASRGLGSYIAKELWNEGANLLLVARSIDKLNDLRDELLSNHHAHQTIDIAPLDLGHAEEVSTWIEKNIKGKEIHILVNNAAIQGPIGPLWENDWQEWQAALQVNLLTPVALCRALIPGMIKRGYGKIINLSGGGATNARPHFSSYAVAKTALVRLSETLSEEVKAFPITINCIAPGVMNTALLANIMQAGMDKAGAREFDIAKNTVSSDHSVEKKAAELCAFLASSSGDGISGKLISAKWDPWQALPDFLHDLKQSDIYTLRRITPKDRGKSWGDDL